MMISSCALKIFEKIVYLRLQWLMESQTILSQEQMGFRPNRQLGYSHTNNIHTSFLENVIAAAFFNITGVFDNVLPEDCFRILSETQKIGVSAKLRTFIENIITHRSVHFVEKSHLSEAYSIHKRTPQYSMLSPLLFNISVREESSTTPWN